MPKNKIINNDQKKRILDLASKNLSTKEIAKIMNIGEKSVNRYKKIGDKIGSIKNNKIVKRNRKRGMGNTDDNINKKRTNLPRSEPQDNAPIGEKTEQLENLVFVGGKKLMPKKEENKTKTEDEKNYYRCFNCHYYQETIFKECPKCGTVNVFEE